MSWQEREEEERQARTTTDEGVHSEASQQRKRMVGRSVPEGRVRITTSPGQDGSTINDEITCPNESSSESLQNGEHEERLVQRGSGCVATFALLGSAGNARLSLFVQWQPTGQGYRRPTREPVVLSDRLAPQSINSSPSSLAVCVALLQDRLKMGEDNDDGPDKRPDDTT